MLSNNVYQKKLETVFLIVIFRPTCEKWQTKAFFSTDFLSVRRLLRVFLIAAYPV